MQNLTKTEWHDWKKHPVTAEFFKKVNEAREELFQRLASFQFTENDRQQNQVIGMINSLTKILDADYEEA